MCGEGEGRIGDGGRASSDERRRGRPTASGAAKDGMGQRLRRERKRCDEGNEIWAQVGALRETRKAWK